MDKTKTGVCVGVAVVYLGGQLSGKEIHIDMPPDGGPTPVRPIVYAISTATDQGMTITNISGSSGGR